MPLRPDRFRVPASSGRAFLAVAIGAVLLAMPSAWGYEDLPDLNPDGTEARKPALSSVFEIGTAASIGSDLGFQPQLTGFRDLPKAWQAGLQARIASKGAVRGYDYLPQMGLSLRKLWLGDGDSASVRNAEYFGMSLGGFFAYNFDGEEAGLKPFGSVSIGKYWMPLSGSPLGLDLNLELTRYLSGHLPYRSQTTYVNLGLHLLYRLP
jgi:hypothetical protein